MNSDFSDLLKFFEDFEVKYLIIGGHAVMLYSEPRHTKDLDIWVEASAENSQRVFSALAAFGAPLEGMSASDFARKGYFYQLGRPPVRVDILMSIDGVDFGHAWINRKQAQFGDRIAYFIGLDDLIRNKLATGRLIDQYDAVQLSQIRDKEQPEKRQE